MDRLPDNFIPLKGHVLVRRDEADAQKGGIIIPEVYRLRGCRAEVVQIGKNVKNIQPGDNILFQKEYTVLPFKEREMAITEADYILAKLELDGNIERIMPLESWVLIRSDRVSKQKGNIQLSDKTQDKTSWGTVVRIGGKCVAVKPEKRVFFETEKGLICVENGAFCRLLKEDDILCILE